MAAHSGRAGFAEHLATVVAAPAQTGSAGLAVQVAVIRATQPASDGSAVHCAMVTEVTVQTPGAAAHKAAHPERDGLAMH